MRRLQTLAAYLAILALVGVSSVKSAEEGTVEGTATVRKVNGHATYTTPDGTTHELTGGTELAAGSTITTGPDTFVYVSVNGVTSAVRIAPESTLTIKKMTRTGGREGNFDTQLSLQVGTIVGQVKKVSADSRYEIETPHGVAGIRGTDFEVQVVADGNGQYTVTFTSITGTVIASAVVNGSVETETLTGQMSWTVGGQPQSVEITLFNSEVQDINNLINIINQGLNPGPQPIGPILIRPQPGGGSPS